MKYLFDTSVWIDHFKKEDKSLRTALEENNLVINEVIIGELAAGNIPKRKQTLRDLILLDIIPTPRLEELLAFIEIRRLFALSLSWSDIQIMASALLAKVDLITSDKKLYREWKKINK